MRWSLRKWRQFEHDTQGLEEARQILAKARADEMRVAEIAEAHRRIRKENHFGPRIAAALREGPRR